MPLCPVISVKSNICNLYANVATIMGHSVTGICQGAMSMSNSNLIWILATTWQSMKLLHCHMTVLLDDISASVYKGVNDSG